MPLRLTRRHGSPHWYIRGKATKRGLAVDESTGVADRTLAEQIRARREWEIIQGDLFGRKTVATFLEAAVGYMEQGGERRFLGPLIERLGPLPLAQIDQDMIDATARAIYPQAAPATRNRHVYTPVSAVLRHAAARGLAEPRIVRRPVLPKGRVRWLTPAEADRLINAAAGHLKPLLVFLFATGARLSEALYLDWRQLDLGRRHVTFLDTKNGEDRGVPLHARAVGAIARLRHRSGAVFRRPDGRAYARKDDGGGQIKTAFKGACRRAGIVDLSPHDCRHTWATWHYAANRNLPALMKLGGWKNERMVLRYAHVNVAHLAATIDALPWGKSGERPPRKSKRAAAPSA